MGTAYEEYMENMRSVKTVKEIKKEKTSKINILLVDGGKAPFKGSTGAAAFDCYAREKVEITPDKPVIIPLGFKIELPEGYCAKIIPRSSTGLKTKIRQANGTGLIDCDYRGEVGFIAELKEWAVYKRVQYGETGKIWGLVEEEPVIIKAGERICQMLIEKVETIELVEVSELSETSRGEGGFGSTGK